MESKVSLKERIIAIFVVILVIASLVAFSFAVPWTKVHAESVADEWEDYVDNMFGEGSSYLVESALEKAGGPAMIGVMYGLNIIETYPSGAVPINTLSTRQGWCYNRVDGKKYLVNTTISSGTYHSSDGGMVICQSGFFTVNAAWIGSQNHSIQNYISGGYCGSIYYPGPAQDFSCDITSNFTNGSVTYNFTNKSSASDMCWIIADEQTSIPTVDPVNDDISDYFKIWNSVPYRIASRFSGSDVNWSNYMESLGISSSTTIDPSNIFDFIVNIYNPAIEEEYPDLTVYLFYPEEPTTDTTGSSGGCNCHVYVYVTEYFDPEINVYVTEYITVTNNVEIELPSEWVQDYTFATDPTELPVPTLPTDPLTSEPVTYPSIDESQMQEYEEEFGDGIRFWLWLTGEFVEKLGLQTICGFVFVVAVAGFVLWKAGGSGGGKND